VADTEHNNGDARRAGIRAIWRSELVGCGLNVELLVCRLARQQGCTRNANLTDIEGR
jgi:hypothetical protein